jgi:hypothetical protein
LGHKFLTICCAPPCQHLHLSLSTHTWHPNYLCVSLMNTCFCFECHASLGLNSLLYMNRSFLKTKSETPQHKQRIRPLKHKITQTTLKAHTWICFTTNPKTNAISRVNYWIKSNILDKFHMNFSTAWATFKRIFFVL